MPSEVDVVGSETERRLVKRICDEASLPPGKLLLLLGDTLLDPMYQAITVARIQVRTAANLYGLEDLLFRPWDCAVSVGRYWTERATDYPAYFSYLIGHELGHVHTALVNINLTLICEDFLARNFKAVSDRNDCRWDELPHEARYDQFGLAVAERIHGRAEVEAEFKEIIDKQLAADSIRLTKVLSNSPRLSLEGLREDIARFCQPRRANLMALWRAQASRLHWPPECSFMLEQMLAHDH